MSTMKTQLGAVIVMAYKHFHVLSLGQRVFTRQPWTHTAIMLDPIVGVDSFIGADLTVDVQPFAHIRDDHEAYDYVVFDPLEFTTEQITAALAQTYTRFAGKTYGFLQLLWFIERWTMWTLFKKDVRKWHNPFPNGTICSEVVWWYLWFLGEYRPEIRTLLDHWRSDTFHAGDAAFVMSILGARGLFAPGDEWLGSIVLNSATMQPPEERK